VLQLESYQSKNGIVFSLKEGYFNKVGSFSPVFCKRMFKGEEKTAPLAVKIGDQAKVIEVALMLLKEITGKDYSPTNSF
jgi:hypothetical protein